MALSQLGVELDDEESALIAEFLASLTGEQPQIGYPVLPPSTAATPKPRL
jgi:cytochrome c peroxidase